MTCAGVYFFTYMAHWEHSRSASLVKANSMLESRSISQSLLRPGRKVDENAINILESEGAESMISHQSTREAKKKEDDDVERIELKDDYYALTWCSFQKKVQVKYNLTSDEPYGHLLKAFFISGIQLSLIYLVYRRV